MLRDAFYGLTRFDEFQKSLAIAPNMLTRRLTQMVEDGLFERRQYSEKPPRFEYVLTPRGWDFRPVMLTLMNWGNRHFAPEGTIVYLAETASGAAVQLQLIDANSGQPISGQHAITAGPAANDRMRQRLEASRLRREQNLRQFPVQDHQP
ncbi:transcriptional regulator [Pseudomonas turukhanskensis]|uniref:Transcriptional regulator n=1 Tax=Pseudomonas turukhanskensis TaxID=1806536 RepID=A0A9W6K1F4_9PSED|nr:transcriptional regulator [Pseudomonas turukhanskensis]